MRYFPARHRHKIKEVLSIIEQNPTKFSDLAPSKGSKTKVRRSARRCVAWLEKLGKIKLVYIGREAFYVSVNWDYDPKVLFLEQNCRHSICGCIEWMGYIDKSRGPMGRFGTESPVSIRRTLWERKKGEKLTDKDRIEMSCHSESCVNTAHMRKIARGSNRKGEKRSFMARINMAKAARGALGKLNMQKAEEIRQSKETLKVLAERYGVSVHAISLVRLGKTWREFQTNPFSGLFTGLAANDPKRRAA